MYQVSQQNKLKVIELIKFNPAVTILCLPDSPEAAKAIVRVKMVVAVVAVACYCDVNAGVSDGSNIINCRPNYVSRISVTRCPYYLRNKLKFENKYVFL